MMARRSHSTLVLWKRERRWSGLPSPSRLPSAFPLQPRSLSSAKCWIFHTSTVVSVQTQVECETRGGGGFICEGSAMKVWIVEQRLYWTRVSRHLSIGGQRSGRVWAWTDQPSRYSSSSPSRKRRTTSAGGLLIRLYARAILEAQADHWTGDFEKGCLPSADDFLEVAKEQGLVNNWTTGRYDALLELLEEAEAEAAAR